MTGDVHPPMICQFTGWFTSLHGQWLGECTRRGNHAGVHRNGRGVA